MNKELPNPYLSNMKLYEDSKIGEFYSTQSMIVKKRLEENRSVVQQALKTGLFKILISNSNLVILKNENFNY
jgi:hypothetical protein